MTEAPVLDYGAYQEAPADNILGRISAKALELQGAEGEVERLQGELKKAQDKLRHIAEHELPALMDEAEQEECTTKDGLKVSVKEQLRGSIPAANKEKAFSWLEANNHANLIKRQFKIFFGKDEEKWAAKFMRDLQKRKRALNVEQDSTVHPQSLLAFAREALKNGEELPLDLLGIFRARYAKVEVKT